MPVVTSSFTLPSALTDGAVRVSLSALDLGRALYLYIGVGDAPAALGSLFAAAPGRGASVPASSALLLDGASAAADATEADFFSAQLSARTGRLVLLSYNVSGDLVDGGAGLEIKKRALAFVLGLAPPPA